MKITDAIWNSKIIKDRMGFEAVMADSAKPHYWFVVPTGKSRRDTAVLKNYTPGVLDIDPHEMQQVFARDLREALQEQINHDGIWMVGWTNPPASGQVIATDGDNVWGRLAMIWLDEDGDPQFTVESESFVIEIISNGVMYYVDLCEQAYKAYAKDFCTKVLKKDMGLKEDQMTKAVLSSLN